VLEDICEEDSEGKRVSLKKLADLLDLFNMMPLKKEAEKNSSRVIYEVLSGNNLTNATCTRPAAGGQQQQMLDLLWIKIEERFHNMADGYRFFDVNYDNFAGFQRAIDSLRINFQVTQLDLLFRTLDRGNKGFISYGDFCELSEERRRKIDAFKTPEKDGPTSSPGHDGALKEFLHRTPITELERANKQWSTPMRQWRAKRESSLPPLIQDNFAAHIFGKPSVDAHTDIRVGPLIKNDFNRSYLEGQHEKQA
jgi:hypothetical protein